MKIEKIFFCALATCITSQIKSSENKQSKKSAAKHAINNKTSTLTKRILQNLSDQELADILSDSQLLIGSLKDEAKIRDQVKNFKKSMIEYGLLDKKHSRIRIAQKSKYETASAYQLNDTKIHPEVFCNKEIQYIRSLEISAQNLRLIPSTIEQLIHLNEIYLDGNKLTLLPQEVCNLVKLKTLFMPNNRLASLPDSIGKLTKLEILILRDNSLTDLPLAIKTLKNNLKLLDLRGNKIKKETLARLTTDLPYTDIRYDYQ